VDVFSKRFSLIGRDPDLKILKFLSSANADLCCPIQFWKDSGRKTIRKNSEKEEDNSAGH